MRLIKPSYSIIEQPPGLEGVYKMVEIAGRTCYKSENNITEDSAKAFVDRMIKSGHGAMLEHGTVYLDIPWNATEEAFSLQLKLRIHKYDSNEYSRVVDTKELHSYITTNLRVLVENGWLDDLQYICEPTEYHIKRVTVRFITDQGILREFTRHRSMSFAVESTRYCNYSKERFNNEVTFIYPCWLPEGDLSVEAEECFKYALQKAEQSYFHLLQEGWKPQQARNVLPLATKCEIIMTGFVDDWKHFFFLRDAAPAHPQARELAEPLHKEFIEKGYIK
jgi:thymidylate synthase (FAD)